MKAVGEGGRRGGWGEGGRERGRSYSQLATVVESIDEKSCNRP